MVLTIKRLTLKLQTAGYLAGPSTFVCQGLQGISWHVLCPDSYKTVSEFSGGIQFTRFLWSFHIKLEQPTLPCIVHATLNTIMRISKPTILY